jgi:hypothetical protein
MSTEATGDGGRVTADAAEQDTAVMIEPVPDDESPDKPDDDDVAPANAQDDDAGPDAGAPDETGDDETGDDETGDQAWIDDEADGEDEAVEDEPAARPARRWPRVLLAFGFVLLALAIVGGAVAIVGSVTHGFKKPVKVTYKKSAVFSLKTGDCLDPRGNQSYTLISCDSAHVAEVFGTFALGGTKWPGTTAVAAQASAGCATRLTGYLNPQLAITLASTYVYPDSAAWQAGTRTVICEVRASSGDLTGSVRGATATAG